MWVHQNTFNSLFEIASEQLLPYKSNYPIPAGDLLAVLDELKPLCGATKDTPLEEFGYEKTYDCNFTFSMDLAKSNESPLEPLITFTQNDGIVISDYKHNWEFDIYVTNKTVTEPTKIMTFETEMQLMMNLTMNPKFTFFPAYKDVKFNNT